jgi:hypothetical protein
MHPFLSFFPLVWGRGKEEWGGGRKWVMEVGEKQREKSPMKKKELQYSLFLSLFIAFYRFLSLFIAFYRFLSLFIAFYRFLSLFISFNLFNLF